MFNRHIPTCAGDLRPAPYNPRVINDSAREGLKASMESLGDISGLVFNVRTGVMVCGHQRTSTFPRDAEIKDVRSETDEQGTVGYGHIEADGTRWRVRFVDWDEPREKLANLAANAPTIAGEFTSGVIDMLSEITPLLPEEVDRMMLYAIPELTGLTAEEKDEEEQEPTGDTLESELAPRPYESFNMVHILSDKAVDWPVMQALFDLKPVKDIQGMSSKYNIGLGRVVTFKHFIERLRWIANHRDQFEALLRGEDDVAL